MQRKLNMIICLFTVLSLLACEPQSTEFKPIDVVTDTTLEAEEDETIRVWTTVDTLHESINQAFKEYPELTLEIEVINAAEVVDLYYEALISKRPPDIFFVQDEYVGLFSEIDGFIDFDEFITDRSFYYRLPNALMDRYVNLKGEQYAVPMVYLPYVTYYRHDILSMYDFPTEPEALERFMSTKDNYFSMARTLFEDERYILESSRALLQLGLQTSYPFTPDYTYQFDQGPFKQVIDVVSLLNKAGIYTDISLQSDYGHMLLENDQLVMFHMPIYGVNQLEKWVPKQQGKWRMTNLPLGLNGIDREETIVGMISDKSPYADEAFRLLEFITRTQNHQLYRETEHPMLDQNNLRAYYATYLATEVPGRPSMLDLYARRHWHNTMFDIDKGTAATSLLFAKTHDRLEEEIKVDQRILIEKFVREMHRQMK